MTLTACIIITAVVWVISLLRSVRLRAFVYSIPLPMTVVLAFTPVRVDGVQLVGIVLLNVFFLVVGAVYQRLGWNIFLADGVGVLVYVLLGSLVPLFSPLSFAPTLVAVSALWLVVNTFFRLRTFMFIALHTAREEVGAGIPCGHPAPLTKLTVVFFGSLLTVGLGQLLNGLVVTFPYSGVLVAIESRHTLATFSRHLVFNSLSLVAFIAAYYLMSGSGKDVALTAAWAGFALCAIVLHSPGIARMGITWASRPRPCTGESEASGERR